MEKVLKQTSENLRMCGIERGVVANFGLHQPQTFTTRKLTPVLWGLKMEKMLGGCNCAESNEQKVL
jgi:hypothetical protein